MLQEINIHEKQSYNDYKQNSRDRLKLELAKWHQKTKQHQWDQICQFMDCHIIKKYRQHMHSEGFVNALLAIPAGIFQSNYTSYSTLYTALWVTAHVQGQNGDSWKRNVTSVTVDNPTSDWNCNGGIRNQDPLQSSSMDSTNSPRAGSFSL